MKSATTENSKVSTGLTVAYYLLCLIFANGLVAFNQVHAQTIFRIVGSDGRVTFSDKPPTNDSGKSTTKTAAANSAASSSAALPFELRQLVSTYPVTLFSANDCAPCDSGRNFLHSRGIPFTEKTVNSVADSEALQRLSGSSTLPFLTLGSQQIKGFSELEWGQYLSAAGYPASSQLPARYVNPAPSALVSVQTQSPVSAASSAVASPEAVPTISPATPAVPRTNNSNPAGIQF